MANDNSLVININGSAKNFLDELDKIKKQTKSLEEVLSKTAKSSAALFAGFAASIAVVTKSFVDYEKALVGVGKTTGLAGQELKKFGKEFQKLSTEIPISTNELLGIGQAAGQLGVQSEDIIKFTETIAKLGVATDLTGEEAATSITRILNVTGTAISEVDTFGSVLVRLGNSAATSESNLVKVTTEVAKATSQFRIGATNAAGISTALAELGQQAQLGGSVVGRSFRQIEKIIRGPAQGLKNLADLTGIAGDQLAQTFRDDATQVFTAFLSGLRDVEKGQGSITETLEQFGLQGDEINKVLPTLATNFSKYEKALKLANDEAKTGTALNEEAAAAFDTLGSAITRGRNNLTNIATNIGEQLAPSITELVEGINSVTSSIAELDEETLSSVATFLKWGAIISATVAGLASFALGAIKVSGIITTLISTFTGASLAAGTFLAAITGPIGIAVAGIAALTAGFLALKIAIGFDEEEESIDSLNEKIAELGRIKNAIASEDNARTPLEKRRQAQRIQGVQDEIDELKKLAAEKEKANSDNAVLTSSFEGPLEGFDEDLFGVTDPKPVTFKQEGKLEETVEGLPLKGREETDEEDAKEAKRLAKLKAAEDAKLKLRKEAASKRIADLRAENEQLKELQSERNEGSTEEELANLERKQAIEDEFREARKIKDDEERALALENLKLKNEEELAEIEAYEAEKDVRAEERREERKILQDELNEEEKAAFEALSIEEQEALQTKIDTQAEAQKKADKEKLDRRVAEQNKFKQDEIKFGTEIATLKKFFNSEEVAGAKNAANQLVQLTNSKNSTLKGIGKAAARTQAAIKTAEGAISAYASLSGVPLVGPVLGAAAAASILAYGIEQQQKISAARTGGFVPPQGGGSIDRVPMLLEPNELVVPSALAPNFIQSVGQPQSGDFANDDASAPESGESVIRLEGDLIQNEDFVAALATKLRDAQEFDNVRL